MTAVGLVFVAWGAIAIAGAALAVGFTRSPGAWLGLAVALAMTLTGVAMLVVEAWRALT